MTTKKEPSYSDLMSPCPFTFNEILDAQKKGERDIRNGGFLEQLSRNFIDQGLITCQHKYQGFISIGSFNQWETIRLVPDILWASY